MASYKISSLAAAAILNAVPFLRLTSVQHCVPNTEQPYLRVDASRTIVGVYDPLQLSLDRHQLTPDVGQLNACDRLDEREGHGRPDHRDDHIIRPTECAEIADGLQIYRSY